MTRFFGPVLWFLTAILPAAAVAQTERPVSIVLVRGAFVDGSGWQATYDLLSRRGYEVLMSRIRRCRSPAMSKPRDDERNRQQPCGDADSSARSGGLHRASRERSAALRPRRTINPAGHRAGQVILGRA